MMAAPTLAQEVAAGTILNSISAFNLVDWCDHFDSLKSCVIIADTGARVVQFWSPDENVHKVSPSSVSLGDDLTRLSYN